MIRERKFWVISPHLNPGRGQEDFWMREILKRKYAFMGWGNDHSIGSRFANKIERGDIILIARQDNGNPKVVGFGIATGQHEWAKNRPEIRHKFGSLHKLGLFRVPRRIPANIDLMKALNHTMSLVQLHPERNAIHKKICKWMEKELAIESKRPSLPKNINQVDSRLQELQFQDDSEFQVRKQEEVIVAKREEFTLLNDYIKWHKNQGRKLHFAQYGRLCCDAFDEERNNLIEAKRGTKREHIRMAAGQLLDYAFQGRKQFGKPNLAILLPKKPLGIEQRFGWLKENNIHLIWKDRKGFADNCNGQFI